MKTTTVFVPLLLFFISELSAQKNVGIGTTTPHNKLEVQGNLVVTQQTVSTTTVPTTAQTKTMINNTTVSYSPSDSTGRFFDPGGPNGDYFANITYAECGINSVECNGIQLWFETMDLAAGDSLIIRPHEFGPILLAVGNGYTATGSHVFDFPALEIRFKSDDSLTTLGAGFSILFKRLYADEDQPEVGNFSGPTFYFDARSGALQSGRFFVGNAPGDYSVALGYRNSSIGHSSVALGYSSSASAANAFAFGRDCSASAAFAMAMGRLSVANGDYAFAAGNSAHATGLGSVALGPSAHANGVYATTLGCVTIANGYGGTVVGYLNDPIVNEQTSMSETTPLFIVGNGDDVFNRSNAMVVRKDGHIGVGTNSPRTRLHVANGSDVSYDNAAGFVVVGSVNDVNIVIDDNEILARDNGAASDLYIQKEGGKVFIGATDSPNFLFNVNGTAGKDGGGSWATLSDRRLKENIHPYSDGLNTLLKIRPVSYQYNTLSGYNTTAEHIGVIAQELQEVAPYMVTTAENRLEDGSPGFLSVDNSAMTYMLINAVKELHQENLDLKSEIATIKDLLYSLVLKNPSLATMNKHPKD